jgi:hypothetical protein
MKMPIFVRFWLMLLVVVNMVVPLFFLGLMEARIVLVTFLASMMLMTVLTAYTGFTRLLGLGHILWFPLIYFLWTRLDQIPSDNFFGIWILVLMALNAISLVVDVADVTRYITGDREETVKDI